MEKISNEIVVSTSKLLKVRVRKVYKVFLTIK
jgi:hypothetical protein